MNVLLVNTNRMKPAIAPIGLDYLADALVVAGHDVRLLDLCFTNSLEDDIAAACRSFAPHAVGLTVRNTDDCYFSGQAFFLPEIKRIFDLLRQHTDAPVVLGGVGFSIMPAAVMGFCSADFGIAGEGEVAFVEFLNSLQRRRAWETVPNLLFRENGVVRQNRAEPVDLSRLPARRRTFVDNRRYFAAGGQAGFESKRGCAMPCVYCAEPMAKGRVTRLMPPAAVAAELAALVAQGVDHFHTCDSEFNLPAGHAREVCRAIIQAGLGEKVRWYAYCAPKPFDGEMAALFKRAGCAGIDFGADSGNDAMLGRLGRPFRACDLADTARICREHGLRFMYDLLLGGPGETRESLRESITLMRRLEPDCVGLSIGMRVYDGTAAAQFVRDEGEPEASPNLHGATRGNSNFLKPVFYIAPTLGREIVAIVRELVAGDTRFFLPEVSSDNANYNYNDNTALVQAIAAGARGAYWDILNKMGKPGTN
ncbi:MAG: cobalamin B12-binding domain-containing protein [Verrucomicrobia bacterium]|nr:cobalamin B12-binding domain-containing protein [Verrucomicrobiota bacterium]